jgi:hypothetical protein
MMVMLKRRLSGSSRPPAAGTAFARCNRFFVADRRGAVAFETIIVYAVLMLSLLLPLTDVTVAGFQYMSAWAALRAFGQYVQYNAPTDPTNISTWKSGLTTSISGYTISNINVLCGAPSGTGADSACTSVTVSDPVKYYTYSTTVTLAPILLTAVLCPTSCTYTLSYSERFQ